METAKNNESLLKKKAGDQLALMKRRYGKLWKIGHWTINRFSSDWFDSILFVLKHPHPQQYWVWLRLHHVQKYCPLIGTQLSKTRKPLKKMSLSLVSIGTSISWKERRSPWARFTLCSFLRGRTYSSVQLKSRKQHYLSKAHQVDSSWYLFVIDPNAIFSLLFLLGWE